MDATSALRAVIEQGFGRGDLDVADRFAGAVITEHEYLAPVGATGAESLRAQITAARAQAPGMTMAVEDMVSDGDMVWARSIARVHQLGALPPGGSEHP